MTLDTIRWASEAKRWLTPPAIAEALGVSHEKVMAWIKSGELPAVDVAARGSRRPRFRISPEAFAEFLERRAVAPPPPRVKRRRSEAQVRDYFAEEGAL